MNKAAFCRNHFVALGIVMGALSAGVHAAPASFLNGTIVRHVPAKDLPSFRSALGDVLNGSQDGATTNWRSTHAQPSKAINVAMTPLQTAQTKSASTCRMVKADVARSGQSESWQFWFCKQADGTWKSSGSTPAQ